MDWKIGKVSIVNPPMDFFGFVYRITFEDGTRYIGRKNFFSNRKRNFGKKELALITDKRKKKYEIVTKESDWRTYNSSNSVVKEKIRNGENYSKEILRFAKNKKHLTYLEEQELYCKSVLLDKSYLNDNIAGRFFTKDAEGWVSKKN